MAPSAVIETTAYWLAGICMLVWIVLYLVAVSMQYTQVTISNVNYVQQDSNFENRQNTQLASFIIGLVGALTLLFIVIYHWYAIRETK